CTRDMGDSPLRVW
nr:immunoglobulin heavy chain junction region [Macaca mulatta]